MGGGNASSLGPTHIYFGGLKTLSHSKNFLWHFWPNSLTSSPSHAASNWLVSRLFTQRSFYSYTFSLEISNLNLSVKEVKKEAPMVLNLGKRRNAGKGRGGYYYLFPHEGKMFNLPEALVEQFLPPPPQVSILYIYCIQRGR